MSKIGELVFDMQEQDDSAFFAESAPVRKKTSKEIALDKIESLCIANNLEFKFHARKQIHRTMELNIFN